MSHRIVLLSFSTSCVLGRMCIYNQDFHSCHRDICPWMLPPNTHFARLQVASTSVMREIKELRSSSISRDVTNHGFRNHPISYEDINIQSAVCLLVCLFDGFKLLVMYTCISDGTINILKSPLYKLDQTGRYQNLVPVEVSFLDGNHNNPGKSNLETRFHPSTASTTSPAPATSWILHCHSTSVFWFGWDLYMEMFYNEPTTL